MKTKRILSILLMLALCVSLFAACGQKATTTPTDDNKTTVEDTGSDDVTEETTDITTEDVATEDTTTEETPEDTTTEETTTEDVTTEDTTEDVTTEDVTIEEPEQTTEDATTETPEPAEKIDINIAAMKGPTSIGMVKLMKQAEDGSTTNNYHFTLAGTADEITPQIIKGELQIAAVPCNLASVLFNKTEGGIKVAGINVTSVLYVVETGDSIHSVEDLRGKTIYSTGKGTTPEYTLNQLLLSAGIDPAKDVTIEYKSEAAEVAAILAEAEDAIAMLPQPFITTAMMQNDRIRIALDVNAEWEALNENSSVVTGVVVVNSKFAEENPEAVAAFLDEYASSVEFVNTNIEEGAGLVEEYGITKAVVATKAIPYCNVCLITGDAMQTSISAYLEVLFNQNPQSVGGALPTEDFYLK